MTFQAEAAEELSRRTGITFYQALTIIQKSEVVNVDNWRAWTDDIERVCKLDTINA